MSPLYMFVAFVPVAALVCFFTRTDQGRLLAVLYLLVFAMFLPWAPAHADTVAHANGQENRMLVLTDDRCTGSGPGQPGGHVAIVLSFFKQASSDAPGYIVASGCWVRQSDVTLTISWDPDGFTQAFRADRFHWKSANKTR